MNKEIVHSANDPTPRKPWWIEANKKTPAQRRERHLTKGTIKFFSGGGLTIFLFFLANALVLKLPPDVIAKVPFEIGPVVHVIWLLGLIPMLTGLGHIIAGFSIRPELARPLALSEQKSLRIDSPVDVTQNAAEVSLGTRREAPASVTERTTNLLDRNPAQ